MSKDNMMHNLLWLDDVRDPFDGTWIEEYAPSFSEGRGYIHWVKNAQEFKDWITTNGLPNMVCFDHDLADEHYTPEEYWDDYEKSKAYQEAQDYTEETGYDCALWLIDYCIDNGVELPGWVAHSFNPVGRDNINRLLTNYLKHQTKNIQK
jgi:hypothetical protein